MYHPATEWVARPYTLLEIESQMVGNTCLRRIPCVLQIRHFALEELPSIESFAASFRCFKRLSQRFRANRIDNRKEPQAGQQEVISMTIQTAPKSRNL